MGKLNGFDPYGNLADVITRNVADHPHNQIEDLWTRANIPMPLKAVA